jgi:hypothetical protein
MLPQYTPYIRQGEIANLPAYHFYMKISALQPEEPFSGETIVTKIDSDKEKITRLIQASRQQYAIEYKNRSEQQKKFRINEKEPTSEKKTNDKPRSGITGVLPEFA